MNPDVKMAIEIANMHSDKGEWAQVNIPPDSRIPVWVHVGTIHTNGFVERFHTSYMIKNGAVVKHTGI